MSRTPVRCAIYTRKSSDEGLEQDFNSLDAQREACAAYVASQKGEGWRLLPQRYDDGGVSGGTLDRPALQRLLADMDAHKVDLIVVYKVDRLTRSLADFAKLVERFDAAGASFVSVTQQFNTATSMGRLTLNVLLSFAQFEREVTAERIRDKIAASKKKGLWMGGLVPLGYDVKDRSLVINQGEAKTVRTIFQLYLDLGCVRRVKEEADRRGLVSKQRHFENGGITGGVPLTRGRIYHLLTNPIYIGEIRHKHSRYPGQHPAIIAPAIFEVVKLKLEAQAGRPRAGGRATTTSPLAGKMIDTTGDLLTPTHALSHGRRHRYYVSRRLITESGKPDLGGWRLPAIALEEAVSKTITEALQNPKLARDLILEATPEILRRLPAALSALTAKLRGPERDAALKSLVAKGVIEPGQLSITLSAEALAESMSIAPEQLRSEDLQIQGAFTLRRRGVEAKLVMGNGAGAVDRILLKTIAKGWLWLEEIKAGTTMQAIAQREGITQRRVAHLVDLAFLAPDIVTAVVESRQPSTLTADRLVKARHRPLWEEQRALIAAE